jgi:hypothetical protein
MIGGLVLLALLLTPALARTRVVDQAFQCRNNLRQLLHGWRMFADENSDNLPNCFGWVQGWLSYNTNNTDNTNLNYLVRGQLGPYVKNPLIYKCPADQSQAIEGAVKLPRVRTLSMSQAFAPSGEGYISTAYRQYVKCADMVAPSPANLWVMICESPGGVNDGAFAVVMTPHGGKWQDGPSILHDGGCGFAFADGHYEMKKRTDSRTLRLNVTYTSPFPHGITQTNNLDIQWVQDRTTAPK